MAAKGGSSPSGSTAPVPAPAVEIAVSDTTVTIDGEVSAQPTKLVATNEGKEPHQVYLAALNKGVTEQDVEDALKKSPDALFPLLTIAGSFPGEGSDFAQISSGGEDELIVDFPEGTYMVIDPESKQMPFGLFEVGAVEGTPSPEPEADYVVEAGDFYFKVGDAIAGPALVKITNEGEQSHEVSVADTKEKGESSEVAFSFAPPPGGALWTRFDIEAGTYGVKCFFPDEKSGKPHFKLGMETTFSISE